MIQIQSKQLVPPSRTRNYGIDLLRLVAMFYVIILHSLGKGGIIYNAAVDSPQYKLSWAMEMWAFCAVNIFGMISGYVGYSDKEKKYNYSNYITMWLQVVFYGVVISLVVYFIDAELFTKNVFKQMFFPYPITSIGILRHIPVCSS